MTDLTTSDMLTEDQLSEARGFVMRLANKAERLHYDTGKRWFARCKCGSTWPCPEQESLRDGAKLLEDVLTELMYRRRRSRPLNGLEWVQDAVKQARGDYARLTQPIRFGDCHVPAEDDQ